LRNLNRLQNPPLAIVVNPSTNPNIGAIMCPSISRIQYHARSLVAVLLISFFLGGLPETVLSVHYFATPFKPVDLGVPLPVSFTAAVNWSTTPPTVTRVTLVVVFSRRIGKTLHSRLSFNITFKNFFFKNNILFIF
jgi:hypothetical protein